MFESKVYIITAYRWGEYNNHSYIVGVFTNKKKAINCACYEEQLRGGNKYGCEVTEFKLNDYNFEGGGGGDRLGGEIIRQVFDKTSIGEFLSEGDRDG